MKKTGAAGENPRTRFRGPLPLLPPEQNLKSSLRLIDRAYIIDNGRIRYQGTAKELENNEEFQRMHLMI